MSKNETKKMFNAELTDSFDGIVDISKGSLQTLTDTDENMYLSFYTDSLLWSCGYNNPTINRDINAMVKDYQRENKPVDLESLLSDLDAQLKPHLPKKLAVTYFSSENPYPRLLKALSSKRGKTEFLCLEKLPGLFPEEFAGQIYSFEELIADDPKVNIDGIKNTVFPELKTIKLILKKHRSALAGCIINPIITSDASIAKKDLLEPVLDLLAKFNIPIIWDDSTAGFYRTGPIFSYKLYDIQPDVLVYNGSLYNHRSVHFVSMTKRINKLFAIQESRVVLEDVPNYIMLKVVLGFMESSNLSKKIQALGTRFQGKLRALEANCGRKFSIKGKGLILFIDFKKESVADSFVQFMKEKGILVKKFAAVPQFVMIYPPLIITEKNIDEIVENFKRFFNQPA
ncbi:aminotransferase class III-fold pyridoxal phosphate-dependent enzyme [Eubacterium sp. AM05-23]|uniref:aminotransferase class III-fold pyridoxal phosphate-dependent enzyme n=1 Tax=Eubacterium TaxID=1730 RepID=UPI000890866F|nr:MULTISPECIES: aminotransferase class III-fold pyridoxal phosphate-dependent enzyme [Eubacterium]RHO59521.1 aminotransferase class III-fold pyridoxal phosphate-dependent enzyme [Eubacterium sp. AM05-23]WPK80677.1 Putrescine aminotransferase [Eubacterium maltosivorans]SDO26340.1 4-aminobutyrate aminotransferase [Eubacterium maltosivorans]